MSSWFQTAFKKYNWPLSVLPILIFSLGFVTLLSISPDRAKAQLWFFIAGIGVYILVSFLDVIAYKYYFKFFLFGLTGLLLVTFFLGEIRFGAARWLNLGILTFQPSEFAKVVLIVALASLVSGREKLGLDIKSVVKITALVVPLMLLVLVQPDLGTFIVLAAIFFFVMLFGGTPKVYFLIAFLLVASFSTPLWNSLHDYQQRRVLVFLNPSLDTQGSGYNVIQSLIAVGSGGIYGKGFLRGTQSHLGFLPAFWTDFIFASYAEEWGLLGAFVFLFLYCSLLLTVVYIASKATDFYSHLICIGVFAVLFTQFIINVGMNLGIMPVTGIPLPLMSYGGSSMLSICALLGLVNSIWIWRKT